MSDIIKKHNVKLLILISGN